MEAISGVGAVVTGGLGLYNTIFGGSDSPDISGAAPGSAPIPASITNTGYDAWGNPVTVSTRSYDPASHRYTYSEGALSDEEVAQRKKEGQLRDLLLTNLSKSSTEAMRAEIYQNYADAISQSLHRDVDYNFDKTWKAKDEEMAARGLFGSRAYVDAQSEIARQKTLADTDIANKAELGKENLYSADYQRWLATLGQEYQQQNNYVNQTLAKLGLATQQGTAADNFSLAAYNAQNAANLNYASLLNNQNAVDVASSTALGKNLTDTATGLAYLYGYAGNKKGSSVVPDSGAITNGGFLQNYANFSLN